MTSKQFVQKLSKQVIIKKLKNNDFLDKVANSNLKWYAAYTLGENTIYLRNHQPFVTVAHELCHWHRRAKGLLHYDKYITNLGRIEEEMIAYLTGFKLALHFNEKITSVAYRKCYYAYLSVVRSNEEYTKYNGQANIEVEELLALANKN